MNDFPTCRVCGCDLSDVDMPIAGKHVCASCCHAKQRFEAWHESARERGLYSLPWVKRQMYKVTDNH